ncbi:vitamin K-dependent protein C-like [Anticarsia gemmatalis]|uniref:vitamin K-dependent protein C-like n=1 Tax=Anticarsia gemmatalis TaxID=129554 RepID=UPI003F764774
MPEGIQLNIGRFPWLGVVQHSFHVGGKQAFAITGAILIHSTYALAAAEDVARILPQTLQNNTKLVLWKSATEKFALEVHDYVLHPEYVKGKTTASIALLDLVPPAAADFSDYVAPVRPICLPTGGLGSYENIYSVKLTDITGELQKEVHKMNFVSRDKCDQYYYEAQLHYEKMNPISPVCAVTANATVPCVWDSGTALITRQSWGFWQLVSS